ncbi:hypothetical protein GWN49_02000, partial [Candidatus Bathyarchaeota archaeon]|nr:hypothetical protein [Candidatus Bathyarchaeota archaeon]
NNGYGIWLSRSSNNSISGNNVTNNDVGIWLLYSSNNTIYHNNFIDNGKQVNSEASTNVWDDGYPSGGNYWSDYVIVSVSYVLFLIFVGLVILGLWQGIRRRIEPRRRRFSRGEFGGQMETDIRLTYKRFKELYPHSQITYAEYKKLQAEKAFKRAVSSQKTKRMVR